MNDSPRKQILEEAISHTCGDRDVEYGSPVTNLNDIAAFWETYLFSKYRVALLENGFFSISAEDVAHMNVLQKMARTFSGNVKLDTYEDMAAYSAIAGECCLAVADMKKFIQTPNAIFDGYNIKQTGE